MLWAWRITAASRCSTSNRTSLAIQAPQLLSARVIARTCGDTGFLVIANHGISPQLISDTFAAAAGFFARPEADKLVKVGQYNIGYLPVGPRIIARRYS
jgi:isopenicillin N synthase-like dioxygenase